MLLLFTRLSKHSLEVRCKFAIAQDVYDVVMEYDVLSIDFVNRYIGLFSFLFLFFHC